MNIDTKSLGRVAVVMGGDSAERQVSLWSGAAVLAALQRQGVDAQAVDGIPELLRRLQQGAFDRVFNILHGGDGENGVLQGALDALKVPYTGSGVLGSALALDKARAKQLFLANAVPTPRYRLFQPGADVAALIQAVGMPAIVKPVHEGSSVGVSKVYSEQELPAAIELAAKYDGELLVEQLIDGPEYTVAVLEDRALPAIRIEPPTAAGYDFHYKYISNDTKYHCPAGLSQAKEAEIARHALNAFRVLGCSGWARIDVMADSAGEFYVLEVNTNPGMTDHSLVPKAAKVAGIDFDELCLRVLATSLEKTP
jgi:D-alanine-D-alanine ligase